MNYTHAVEVMAENNVETNISPRFSFCVPGLSMKDADEGEPLVADGTMCVLFIDTEQEKKIDVGVSWPFEKLEPGECLISAAFQTIEIGDKLNIAMNYTNLFINMWPQYETDTAPPGESMT